MRLGFIALAALAGVPFAAPAVRAQQGEFVYAPGTRHYRLTTQVHREQIQGGGRAPFEFDVTTTQVVTVRIAPAKPDTLSLEITVDSVAVHSELNAPSPDVHRLFGVKLTGLISPQGHVYAFDPPAGTTDRDITQLYSAFRRFLVSLPTKPIGVGERWADTVSEHVTKDGFNVVARAITVSRVAGDTTVDGQPAWRIVRHTDIVQSGNSSTRGEAVQLQGQGSVNGVHLVSHDGIYLGSQSTQRLDLMMKNDISETPPISQTIKSKVERLPGGE